MAALSLFDYRFGSTLLHRMEGRSKFLAFIILTPTVFGARPEGLFLLSAGIVIPQAMSGLNPMRLLSGLRPLFLVLGFIWIARALFTPGEPLVSFFFGTVTLEGVSEGALFCWRMLLVVLASVLYSATTRSAQTRDAVYRLLRPFSFVPGKQIADMMGLMLRFIPVISGRMEDITEAQAARCIGNRKNPLRRIQSLAVPLLKGLFIDAHNLSEAMEARGYRPDRPGRLGSSEPFGWIPFALVVFLCLIALIL